MTEPLPPYRPIDCALHSRYELAAMHRQPLHIRWRDQHGDRQARLTPLDLQVRDGAEYLLARAAGGAVCRIRLDRIRSAEPADGTAD